MHITINEKTRIMKTQMTITVNTSKNEVKFFNIEFLKENFNDVMWHIELIQSEKCVNTCVEMGVFNLK